MATTAAELKRRGYAYWRAQPTLESGHFDNLKYDDGRFRVWVSRASLADYDGDRQAWARERLTIEKFTGGRWVGRHADRKRSGRHGNMPAPPKRVATAYAGGREIAVYEVAGRYYARISGMATLSTPHATIREAVAHAKARIEGSGARAAAYARPGRRKRNKRNKRTGRFTRGR